MEARGSHYVTVAQIAAAARVSERAVQARTAKARLTFEKRQIGKATVRFYAVDDLPQSWQRPLKRHLAAPVVPSTVDIPDMKTWQREAMEAKAAILRHLEFRAMLVGTMSKAINEFIDQVKSGSLDPALARITPIANERSSGALRISRAVLYRWASEIRNSPHNLAALAPVAAPEAPPPPWAATLLTGYGRPSKPGIPEVLTAWPDGVSKPSYDQARRFLKRLSAIDRNLGRLGPRALKALKAYIVRDVANLWPGAVFIGDGHTWKAEVAHPIHGRPFRPEITAILDVFTRRWVGWSAALAENTWSVADALRHAVTDATCCDVFYYDNGGGAKNATWDADVTGIIARLGVTKLHSAPWSSQARGVVERFHSTVLHKAARRLPTYVGQRMDKEARHAAFKLTRHDLRVAGASALLTSWPEFLAMIEAERAHYNGRPHSFLPWIIDSGTGKRRHQSPDEAWQAAIDAGWQPDPIDQVEARDLFRPHATRTVSRATVKLFDNLYFSPALEPFHGETVAVGYDIHEAEKVIVRGADGRFLCEAVWDGNKRDYLPVPFVQKARDKRIEGRLKRLDAHRQEALAEATPNLVLMANRAPAPVPLSEEREARLDRIAAQLEAQRQEEPELDPEMPAKQRFVRALDIEQRRGAGEPVSETDAFWFSRYSTSAEYRSRRHLYDDFGDAALA